MKCTETYDDDIKTLLDLCKAGKLFDVQKWIESDKPVNPPPSVSGYKRKSPLHVAIELGFHSLVQVLLEAGADINESKYCPLDHALQKRRLDLVKLLVEHGADIHSVSMESVFETWQPEIMSWFIERGADVEAEKPLAYALCNRIRTALGIFRTYKDRFPSFEEQINIALRYHCKEGNLKWVSLLLWAGADPYSKGPDSPYEQPDPERDLNALEYAALYNHFEIFKLKKIHLDPHREEMQGLLETACSVGNANFLKELLEIGFDPAVQENSGSSLIQALLVTMGRDWDYGNFLERQTKNIDSDRNRERIKMIHMLARQGAKWKPEERYKIADARRSLLKMAPDYTVEFIWIISEHNACSREDIEELIRTPSMRALIANHRPRINELMEKL